jgi:hypothetical protein
MAISPCGFAIARCATCPPRSIAAVARLRTLIQHFAHRCRETRADSIRSPRAPSSTCARRFPRDRLEVRTCPCLCLPAWAASPPRRVCRALPSHSIRSDPPWPRLAPRNQARRLSPLGLPQRRPGTAFHPTRLRLGREKSAHHGFDAERVAAPLLVENPPAKRKRSAAAAKGRPTRGGYHRPSPRKKELKIECDRIHDVSPPKLSRYFQAARV